MAEEEKTNEEGEAPEEKKSKLPMMLGGGGVAVLGLAYLAATMAVPSPKVVRRFSGPFVVQLFEDKIHINLNEEGKKRFLQMNFNVVYTAYEEPYMAARVADPLYMPYVDDCIRRVCMLKKIDDVTGNNQDLFLQELRSSLGPIIFPVHVGATPKPTDRDEASGISPGLSIGKATFRSPFDEGLLYVDAVALTIRLGDGEEVTFEGTENDLELTDERGGIVYLDMTSITEEFKGEVPIGVHGTLREVLLKDLLIQ
jgi:hypothetical protein